MPASTYDDAEVPAAQPWQPPMPLAEARALAAAADADPAKRLDACGQLVQRGATRDAVPALRELEAMPRHATYARRLMATARYVERALLWLDFEGKRQTTGRWQTLDGRAPGESSEPSGALLWVRNGAAKTVLAFSTYAGGFGPMHGWGSVFLAHRFLGGFPLNIVYLRDETYCLNLAGNRSLGADYAASVAALRALCSGRSWNELYTVGFSMGGYSAMRFGLDLGVRAVLSFSGPSTLVSAEYRAKIGLNWFYQAAPAMAADLLPLFQQASRRPRLLLCYGELNPVDAGMAEHMAGLAETELIAFPGFRGHSTFMEAGRLNKLGELTARLTGLPW
jgi:dienelactone hydrolase